MNIKIFFLFSFFFIIPFSVGAFETEVKKDMFFADAKSRTFIYSLLDNDIIPEDKKMQVSSMLGFDALPSSLVLNATRDIRFWNGVYKKGERAEGLLISFENTSSSPLFLSHNEKCPLEYRIYTEGILSYSSENNPSCVFSKENKKTFTLSPKDIRVLEVLHQNEVFPLEKGGHTFVVSYRGNVVGSFGTFFE
jgi:hypothetical protein